MWDDNIKKYLIYIVTYLPKLRIAEPENTSVVRERLCKHGSTAIDSRDRSNRYIRNNIGNI
jgi:hypothetical protein